ncbi:unnamed protein product [Cylicocyclus nassatus]|uniref:Uncharacterized protein n=1 Tax=Cylicocyclus nassatus TaxID=53992 RepID=A0AA36GW81_CYLNA|nr:unnamed protein product [Cylicocyclus nassatus]
MFSSVYFVLLVSITARSQALKCHSGVLVVSDRGKTVFWSVQPLSKRKKIMFPLVKLLMLMLLLQVTVEEVKTTNGKCGNTDPRTANLICNALCKKMRCSGGGYCRIDDWNCVCLSCP